VLLITALPGGTSCLAPDAVPHHHCCSKLGGIKMGEGLISCANKQLEFSVKINENCRQISTGYKLITTQLAHEDYENETETTSTLTKLNFRC